MNPSRRTFLRQGTAVAAGAFVLPRFSIGKPGPSANSKLNVAMIGAGGIADHAYTGCAAENIVALCDVDPRQFPGAGSRFAAQVEGARVFSDFRVMLDKMGDEIDAVCINTPDHTHFVATLAAMERGKHVCTQKPLTHTIWEARTLRKAKARYKVVTNMANQGHTGRGIRTMREWYEAGVFGQVREVHLGFNGPDWGGPYFKRPDAVPPVAQPVPEGFDWDLWLGPAATRAYNRIYHPLTWRGFNDFGTGQFGDWFCHTGDGPVWTLELYEPTVIECLDRGPALDGMVADYSTVRFEFPARGSKEPCTMTWYEGMCNGGKPIKHPEDWDQGSPPDSGSYWFGDQRNGYLDNRSSNPRLSSREAMKAFKAGPAIPEKYPRVENGAGGASHREWIRAIKGEGPEPGANFDYAAALTEVALLGVLAQRVGGRIEWDAKNLKIPNRPELEKFIKGEVRKGWEFGENLWT